jgi:hypothetical protein
MGDIVDDLLAKNALRVNDVTQVKRLICIRSFENKCDLLLEWLAGGQYPIELYRKYDSVVNGGGNM